MIVGTAGHIDHGKTSLVRALTGIDTDRLKEEKARGITIELGFAYLPRPGGQTIGFVDVPGHGRLVHTMLAGATGIDFVLLVVACDDGVMPQTREHVAIIDLLGLQQGVVALTKCDLGAPERITEVSGQVRGALTGTGLADAAIMPVSAVTGAGVEDLIHILDEAVAQGQNRPADKRFRLAVDRVFSLAGAGTVATGAVLSGRVAVGDAVVVSPSGLEARVRSIHAQNRNAQQGSAGQRCALALVGSGIDAASVARGDVVLDPSLHQPVGKIDVRVKLLPSERKALSQWQPVKFHHGSAESDAKIQVLRNHALAPGEEDFARIVLHEPLALCVGDRFVIRDTSATRTVGGGIILDLGPPERHRASPQRRTELGYLGGEDDVEVLQNLLQVRGYMDIGAFFRDRASLPAMADAASQALDLVTFEMGRQGVAMLPGAWARYTTAVVETLEAFHAEHPDLPGLGQERLRLTMSPRLPAVLFSVVLRRLSAEGHVALDRSWVRRPGHVVRFSDEEERIWAQIVPLLQGTERFRPPRVRDVANAQGLNERFVRRLFRMAACRGDVDEISKDHFFMSDTVVEMADIACELAANGNDGQFTVVGFRDRLDNGRKVAIQILEYFDGQGLTMRRSDIRRINPHKRELFSRSTLPLETPPREGGETFPVERPDFKSG
ncbi:MAG: selenocysteine-specific translation elongation factor, partial [Beijerinckiaceae bacterium]|nr:selenocysteine-specific translation elongation factor [Beijerinckiaceae bacterium]